MARFGQDKPPVDEGMVDEEDFYGEGANSPTATKDALPGAVQDASAMVRSPAKELWDQLTPDPAEHYCFLQQNASPQYRIGCDTERSNGRAAEVGESEEGRAVKSEAYRQSSEHTHQSEHS